MLLPIEDQSDWLVMPVNDLRPEAEEEVQAPAWIVYAVHQLLRGIVWSIKFGFIYGLLIPYLLLWLLIFPCLLYLAKLSILSSSLLASTIAAATIFSPLHGPFLNSIYSSVDLVVLHKWVKLAIAFIGKHLWDFVAAVLVAAAIAFAFS